jgi:prevent-host-death family protein
MFSVKGDATIASVTDLRRDTNNLLSRVEKGESVVIQRNRDAVGILIGYDSYSRIMAAMARLGQLEDMLLALRREEERVTFLFLARTSSAAWRGSSRRRACR